MMGGTNSRGLFGGVINSRITVYDETIEVWVRHSQLVVCFHSQANMQLVENAFAMNLAEASTHTHFLFCKNLIYKNIKVQIAEI